MKWYTIDFKFVENSIHHLVPCFCGRASPSGNGALWVAEYLIASIYEIILGDLVSLPPLSAKPLTEILDQMSEIQEVMIHKQTFELKNKATGGRLT